MYKMANDMSPEIMNDVLSQDTLSSETYYTISSWSNA